MRIIPSPITFEWDEGNTLKNLKKHIVTIQEAEELFVREPFTAVVTPSFASKSEKRYQALGETSGGRKLFAAFAIRGTTVRVISVRDMSKKERKAYEDLEEIPKFTSAEEEAAFWDSHDSTDYVDWSKSEKTVLPNLKTSTESISMRLPKPLLARLKGLANERDVPYQSLMKVFLSERVEQERNASKKQR